MGKLVRGIVRRLATVLLAIVCVVALVAIGGQFANLWRFNTVDTGSMRPALAAGDVAVLRAEPVTSLQAGQVVAFHPPHEPTVTVLHRVVQVGFQSGHVVIRTKGDANRVVDPWHTQLHAATAWVMAAHVPYLGHAAVWAHSHVVMLAAYATILVLVVGLGLRRIWRRPAPLPAAPSAPFSEDWWRHLGSPNAVGADGQPMFSESWWRYLGPPAASAAVVMAPPPPPPPPPPAPPHDLASVA